MQADPLTSYDKLSQILNCLLNLIIAHFFYIRNTSEDLEFVPVGAEMSEAEQLVGHCNAVVPRTKQITTRLQVMSNYVKFN